MRDWQADTKTNLLTILLTQIGFWERDQWNGEGKFLDMNGKALKCGFWKDDKLQTAMKEEEIMLKNENKHLII